MKQLTHINDAVYSKLALSKVEKRWSPPPMENKCLHGWFIRRLRSGKEISHAVVLPGVVAAVYAATQFYSYRWNLQLIAANGYIVVAQQARNARSWRCGTERIKKIMGPGDQRLPLRDWCIGERTVRWQSAVRRSRSELRWLLGVLPGGEFTTTLQDIHCARWYPLTRRACTVQTRRVVLCGLGLWRKPLGTRMSAAQKSYTQFDPSSLAG